VKRFGSARFDAVLGSAERDAATRALRSAGAQVTSWRATGRRSYASLDVADGFAPEPVRANFADVRIDVPPLAALRILPRDRPRLTALLGAFAGPGRPSGVTDAYVDGGEALVVEFDAAHTPAAVVVAVADAELAPTPGRTVEALLRFDDAALVAYAGAVLGIPDLTPARLIETYVP